MGIYSFFYTDPIQQLEGSTSAIAYQQIFKEMLPRYCIPYFPNRLWTCRLKQFQNCCCRPSKWDFCTFAPLSRIQILLLGSKIICLSGAESRSNIIFESVSGWVEKNFWPWQIQPTVVEVRRSNFKGLKLHISNCFWSTLPQLLHMSAILQKCGLL